MDGDDKDYSELIIVAFVTLIIFAIIVFLTYVCIVRMRNAKIARVVSIELEKRSQNSKEHSNKLNTEEADSAVNELPTERPLHSSRGNSYHLR